MIARVTLELALRKEFDYLVPAELADQVDVGTRVQVPLGPRKVLGCVTAVAEESGQAKLKPILKVIGATVAGNGQGSEIGSMDRPISIAAPLKPR